MQRPWLSQDDDFKFRFLGKTIQLPDVDLADPEQAVRDRCQQRMAILRGMLVHQLGDYKCEQIYNVLYGVSKRVGWVCPRLARAFWSCHYLSCQHLRAPELVLRKQVMLPLGWHATLYAIHTLNPNLEA